MDTVTLVTGLMASPFHQAYLFSSEASTMLHSGINVLWGCDPTTIACAVMSGTGVVGYFLFIGLLVMVSSGVSWSFWGLNVLYHASAY